MDVVGGFWRQGGLNRAGVAGILSGESEDKVGSVLHYGGAKLFGLSSWPVRMGEVFKAKSA